MGRMFPQLFAVWVKPSTIQQSTTHGFLEKHWKLLGKWQENKFKELLQMKTCL